jgi:4-amino-4-deoxychorismate lyase
MTISQSYLSFNGQPVSERILLSFLNDRGLAYGHGLFESILLHDSKLCLIDRHLSRLSLGATKLNIPLEPAQVLDYLDLFINQLTDGAVEQGVIKVIVTAGEGGRGYQSPDDIKPMVICSYSTLPEGLSDYRTQPLSVRYCEHRLAVNGVLAGIKHLNRLDQVIARNEWRCGNYQEGLMFTESNHLIEAVSANVFVKNTKGQWLTPSLKQVGIAGVMRSLMLDEIFPACSIPVTVAPIMMGELTDCQSLLLCNSVKGLASVGQLHNQPSDWHKSLPIDQQTLMLYEKLIELYPQYK